LPPGLGQVGKSSLEMADLERKWRLIPPRTDDGAGNMALDQALLEAASRPGFPPTLRFFRWSPPALSMGRFQDLGDVDLEACRREGVDVVRRPTGGRTILHLDDFTYSLVLPRGFPFPARVVEAYLFICRGIVAAMNRLGLEVSLIEKGGVDYRRAGSACFASSTQADLRLGGRKICGSAQVRRAGALLQHGSVLMADHSELLFRLLRFPSAREREEALREYRRSCTTLEETGRALSWEEMASAFASGFEEAFRIRLEEGDLTPRERERWLGLVPAYRSPGWLANRQARSFA